jgi:tRNA U34 5-carboxymethylaminomethyl modifying enzyme MnmG/GidA
MKIKDIDTKELTMKAVELISRTFVELGQYKQDETQIVILAQSLVNDCKRHFKNLQWIDIQESFHQGVRADDSRFNLSVQTYFIWIKRQRQIIWNHECDKQNKLSDKNKELDYHKIARIAEEKVKLINNKK